MRLPVLLGLVSLIAIGFSGCGNFGNDYQPGIANRGYVPGQALPNAQAENKLAEKLK
jgi:hypothetical protein